MRYPRLPHAFELFVAKASFDSAGYLSGDEKTRAQLAEAFFLEEVDGLAASILAQAEDKTTATQMARDSIAELRNWLSQSAEPREELEDWVIAFEDELMASVARIGEGSNINRILSRISYDRPWLVVSFWLILLLLLFWLLRE